MNVAGIVLCGGQSSRMGQPKASLPFGAETMLGRIVRIVGEVASPVVVVAAPGHIVPALPESVTILRDEVTGHGPLQGIVTGLRHLKDRADAAYITSCDVPLLRPAFVRRMIELIGDADIAIPHIDGRQHPLAGVYRTRVIPAAEASLAELCRRLTMLMVRVPTRFVRAEEFADVDPGLESLRNVNTPEEYQAAIDVAFGRNP